MTLRVKLAIAMVTLAAGSALTVGFVSYVSTGNQLRYQIDRSLEEAALRIRNLPAAGLPSRSPRPRPGLDDIGELRRFTQVLGQILDNHGEIVAVLDEVVLPVDDFDRGVAAGRLGSLSRDVSINGQTFRMLTVPDDRGGAVQLARSLDETDRVLDSIFKRTIAIVALAALAALLIGVVIAQQITRRLVRLTEAATRVTDSGDLDVEVPVDGDDETGMLGRTFNAMLASLARSKRSQQQLVQDAGHELRTPLTSLRTNVSVMQRYDELSAESRRRLLADVETETKELSTLVNELVELATDRRDGEEPVVISLADAAMATAGRSRRRTERTITVDVDDSRALVRPRAFERALSNLIENALKFSNDEIGVTIVAGRVQVRDHGPGVEAEDLPRVFDRFYRADSARSMSGSGLGLAIVREFAEAHGGSAFATNHADGGAVIGFTLPIVGSAVAAG